MKKHALKVISVIFLALLVWRIVVLVITPKNQSGGMSRPPVAVDVDTVTYAPIQDIRDFTGTVYPLYRYVIAPKVSGRIIDIKKRIGDPVAKGEVIAQIDDAEYQQALIEAEANLRIAEASVAETKSQLALASQELERAQSLREKGIASPAEFDAAQTNYSALQSRLKLAQAQVEQREAALKSAKIRLSYTVLVATEPGYVGERFADEGALLAPNTPVISVIGINRVIVRATIIERDYGLINVGQAAEVHVDTFPDHAFSGLVARIAPMLDESSRVAQMEVDVDNNGLLLKPGMFARVSVILDDKKSTQVVPRQALVMRNGEVGVFIVDKTENVARYRPVQIGISAKDRIEILSPKLEGLVVTLGQHLLEDGSPVILQESENSERPGGKGRPPASGKGL